MMLESISTVHVKQLDDYLLDLLNVRESDTPSFQDDPFFDSDLGQEGRHRLVLVQFQIQALCVFFVMSLTWICCSDCLSLSIKNPCQWITMFSTGCQCTWCKPASQYGQKKSASQYDTTFQFEEATEPSVTTKDTYITRIRRKNRLKFNFGASTKRPLSRSDSKRKLKNAALLKINKLRKAGQSSKLASRDCSSQEDVYGGDLSVATLQPKRSDDLADDVELISISDYDSSITKQSHYQPWRMNLTSMAFDSGTLGSNVKKMCFSRENTKMLRNLRENTNVMEHLREHANIWANNIPENMKVLENTRENTNVIENVHDNISIIDNFQENVNFIENLHKNINIIESLREKQNVMENQRENAVVIANVRENDNVMRNLRTSASFTTDFRENTSMTIQKSVKSSGANKRYLASSYESADEVVDIFDDIQCLVGKKDVVVLPSSTSACFTDNGVHPGKQPTNNIHKILVPDVFEQGDTGKGANTEVYKIIGYADALNFNAKGAMLEGYSHVNIDRAASDLLCGDLSEILRKYQNSETSRSIERTSRQIEKPKKSQSERWKLTKSAKFPSLKVNILLANCESNSSMSANASGNKAYNKKCSFSSCPGWNKSEFSDNSTTIILTDSLSRNVHKDDCLRSSTSTWSTSHTRTGTENTEALSSNKIILQRPLRAGTQVVECNGINQGQKRKYPKSSSHTPTRSVKVLELLNTHGTISEKYDEGGKLSNDTACTLIEPGYSCPKRIRRLCRKGQQQLSTTQQGSLLETDGTQQTCQQLEPFKKSGTYSTTPGNETTQQIITDFFNNSNDALQGNKTVSNNARFFECAMREGARASGFEPHKTQNENCSRESGNYTCACAEGDGAKKEWPITLYSSSTISSSNEAQTSSVQEIHKLFKQRRGINRNYTETKPNNTQLKHDVKTFNTGAVLDHPNQQQFLQHRHRMSNNVNLLQNPRHVNWHKRKSANIARNNKNSRKYIHLNGKDTPNTSRLPCSNKLNQTTLLENGSFSSRQTKKEMEGMIPTSMHKYNEGIGSHKREYVLDSNSDEAKQDNVLHCNFRTSLQRDRDGSACNVTNRTSLQRDRDGSACNVTNRTSLQHDRDGSACNVTNRTSLQRDRDGSACNVTNITSLQHDRDGSACNVRNRTLQSNEAQTSYEVGRSRNNHQTGPEMIYRASPRNHVANAASEEKKIVTCKSKESVQRNESTRNGRKVAFQSDEARKLFGEEGDTSFNQVGLRQTDAGSEITEEDSPSVSIPTISYLCNTKRDSVCKSAELDNKHEDTDDVQYTTKDRMHDHQLSPYQSNIFQTEIERSRKGCIPRPISTLRRTNKQAIVQHSAGSRPSTTVDAQPDYSNMKTNYNHKLDFDKASSSNHRQLLTASHLSSENQVCATDKCKAFSSEKLFRKCNNELDDNLGNHNNKHNRRDQRNLLTNKQFSLYGQKNNDHVNNIFLNSSALRERSDNPWKLKMRHGEDCNIPDDQITEYGECENMGTWETNSVLSPLQISKKIYSRDFCRGELVSPDPSASESETSISIESFPNYATKTLRLSNSENDYRQSEAETSDKPVHGEKHRYQGEENESNADSTSCNYADTATEDLHIDDSQPASLTSEDITFLELTTLNHKLMSSSPIKLMTSEEHYRNCAAWQASIDEQKVTYQHDMISAHSSKQLRGRLMKPMRETCLGSRYEKKYESETHQLHEKQNCVARNNTSRSENVTRVDGLVDKVLTRRRFAPKPWLTNADCVFLENRSSCFPPCQMLQETTSNSSGFDCNSSSITSEDVFAQSRKQAGFRYKTEVKCAEFGADCVMAPALNKCGSWDSIPESARCHGNERIQVSIEDSAQPVNTHFRQTQSLLSQTQLKDKKKRKKKVTAERKYKKVTTNKIRNTSDKPNVKRGNTVRKREKQDKARSLPRTFKRLKLSTINQGKKHQPLIMNPSENTNIQHNFRANRTVPDQSELIKAKAHVFEKLDYGPGIVYSNKTGIDRATKKRTRAKLDNVVYTKKKKQTINALNDANVISKFGFYDNDLPRGKQSTTIESTLRSNCQEVQVNTGSIFLQNTRNDNKMAPLVGQKYVRPVKSRVGQKSPGTRGQQKAHEHSMKCSNEPSTIDLQGLSDGVNLKQALAESNIIDRNEKKPAGGNINENTDLKKLHAPKTKNTKENPMTHMEKVEACSDVKTRDGNAFRDHNNLMHESDLLIINGSPMFNARLKAQRDKSYCRIPKANSTSLYPRTDMSSTKSKRGSTLNLPSKFCNSQSTVSQESMSYHFTEVECPWETSCRRTKLVRIARGEILASDMKIKPKTNEHGHVKEKPCSARVENNKDMITDVSRTRHKQKSVSQSSNPHVAIKERKQTTAFQDPHCLTNYSFRKDNREECTSKYISNSVEMETRNNREVGLESVNSSCSVRESHDKQCREDFLKIRGSTTKKDSKIHGTDTTGKMNGDGIAQDNQNNIEKQRMRKRVSCNPCYMTGKKKLPVAGWSSIKNSTKNPDFPAQLNIKESRKYPMKHGTRPLVGRKIACAKNTTKNNNVEILWTNCDSDNQSRYRSRIFSPKDSGGTKNASRQIRSLHEHLKHSTPLSKAMIGQENLLTSKDEASNCKPVHEGSSQFDFSIGSKLNCDWYKPLRSPTFQPIHSARQDRRTDHTRNFINQLKRAADITGDSHESNKIATRAVEAEFRHNKSHIVTGQYDSGSDLDSLLAPPSPSSELHPEYSGNNTYSLLLSDTSSGDQYSSRINSKSRKVLNLNEENLSTRINATINKPYLGKKMLLSEFRNRPQSVAMEAIVPQAICTTLKSTISLTTNLLGDGLNRSDNPCPNFNNTPDPSQYFSTGGQHPLRKLAINDEPRATTSDQSPTSNFNPKSTTGFSYFYTNSSDWVHSGGLSSGLSGLRENNLVSIRVRQPMDGTFVGQVVKMFEKRLKKCMPVREGN